MNRQQSNRKKPRIPYHGKVDLFFDNHNYLKCSAQNLSLIGMWVLGCPDQEEGNQCDIEFHDATSTTNRPLRIKGEVIRTDEGGIALLFLNINVRAYTDLEAFIHEQGKGPLMEENEFLDELPA
ncbi:MAG: PilZ domain-containing protein [Proteobacteria bacterium]|nr:PilZ domain-containing protein [Desulfobulbaceae bacterium]MBU4151825.1 PilZ domain-containing protein [Pseudomonadota bacterium]MDP2106729.1 PilZ domain-containing protein [Desulfobulbaceae bacterium]